MLWKTLNDYAESRKSIKEGNKSDWEVTKIKNDILATHPKATAEDKKALINAKTTQEINFALERLHEQGLTKVVVSKAPFRPNKHKRQKPRKRNLKKNPGKGEGDKS